MIRRTLANPADMALVVDTHWPKRYADRTEHPPDDAEKVLVEGGRVTRVSRDIATEPAHGEYIGVAKFTAAGAARLREHYHRCRAAHAGRPFREARTFEKAYLIQLFQEMIEAGEPFAHVDTPGGYIEIDTQQDFDYARRHWPRREQDAMSHLFPTSVVGSLPRPDYVKDLINGGRPGAAGRVPPAHGPGRRPGRRACRRRPGWTSSPTGSGGGSRTSG